MNTGVDGRGDDGSDGELTRRRYLSALGAGGVGLASALAGCSESNDIVSSSQVFGFQFPYAPENVHLGPWSTSNPSPFYSLLYEAKSYSAPGRERTLGDVIDSVDSDGATATVTFDDGFSWWSGDPVTARDAWIEERIQSFVADRSYTAELVDDYRLRYEFDRPLDEPLVRSTVASGAVRTRADRHQPYLDRLRDAGTDRQQSEIVSDIRNDSPDLKEAAEQGLGCGPYELVEVSINRLMLEKYEGHPRADEIAIPRLWFPVVQEVSVENLVKKGWLDGGSGRVRAQRGSVPEYLEQLATYRTTAGTKLVLDWRNDHLARRGVRRALLAALPLDDIVEIVDWGDPVGRQTGLVEPSERRWIPERVRERLHRYPVAADEETAAAYMRDAGYSRDGNDEWRGPDGGRVSLRMATPVWDDFVSATEVVSSTLTRFGFDVSVDRLTNLNVYSAVTGHTHDITLWTFDGTPYSIYDVTSDDATAVGLGVSEPGSTDATQGKPVTVSVPETPGDIDAPDSDRRSVDLVETWRDIERPTDRATTVEAITTFANWWNDALPGVYLANYTDGLWGNTRDFQWPSRERDADFATVGPAGQPIFHMLKQGAIRPVTDQ